MKYSQQSVDTFGFPARALKAIQHQGIGNISQLCLLDGVEIMRWRKNGEEAIAEILQALLQKNVRPLWMKTVAAEIQRESADKAPEGWTRITHVCDRWENWMLELAIADMERFQAPWVLVNVAGGRELWRKGGLKWEGEGE